MITRGTCFRVATTTAQDVFGDCVYRIEEVGLPAPEAYRKGEMDGVRCRMLGGSGPSAHAGRVLMDSEFAIRGYLSQGIAKIITEERALAMGKSWEDRNPALGQELT